MHVPEWGLSSLLNLYEIPTLSVMPLLPMARRFGAEVQYNSSYPYSTLNWHTDHCCHPNGIGQRKLALVIVYHLQQEIEEWLDVELTHFERDFTALPTSPVLPQPVKLTESEDELYVFGEATMSVDLSTSAFDPDLVGVVDMEGWTHSADNKDKDKFGLIADKAGAHLSAKIEAGPFGSLTLLFVKSYRDFGAVKVWVDTHPHLPDEVQSCQQVDKDILAKVQGATYGPELADARWMKQASATSMASFRWLQPAYKLRKRDPNSGQLYVHVCLVDRPKPIPGEKNKFKLTGLQTR